MSYASQQDLVDIFGAPELVALTDRAENSTGEIDGVMIARALTEADAEINSYLAKVVITPIDPVPAQVKRLAIDIAHYRLHRDRAPDQVNARYAAAVAWLKGAAAGQVSLGDIGVATKPASGGVVQTDAPNRVFTRDKLRGF